jgi:hypothetical protein
MYSEFASKLAEMTEKLLEHLPVTHEMLKSINIHERSSEFADWVV